jgi:hypothetical protein
VDYVRGETSAIVRFTTQQDGQIAYKACKHPVSLHPLQGNYCPRHVTRVGKSEVDYWHKLLQDKQSRQPKPTPAPKTALHVHFDA